MAQRASLLTLKDRGSRSVEDGRCLAWSQRSLLSFVGLNACFASRSYIIEACRGGVSEVRHRDLIPTVLQVWLLGGYNSPTSAKILWEQTRCPTRRIHLVST